MQVKTLFKDIPKIKLLVNLEEKHPHNHVGLYLLKAQYALEQRSELTDLMAEVNDLACVYCGRLFQRELLTIDHYKPRYLKGTNDLENLVLACEPCNKAKGSIDPFKMPVVFNEFLNAVKQGQWHKRLSFLESMRTQEMSDSERSLLEKLIRMESRPYLEKKE